MRGENYRFFFIGSLVSILVLYVVSFRTILFITPLVIFLWGLWNFRNTSGIRRRLLQSGLILGFAHKSKRVTRSTSNFSQKLRTTEDNHQVASGSSQNTLTDTLFHRREESPEQSGFDFSKSVVPNVGFTSPQAFVFGSPRCGKMSKEMILEKRSPILRNPLSEENKLFKETKEDYRTPGYIFCPTRRVLSVNRRYPTHQSQYGQLGLLPSIHLSPSHTPILNVKSKMGHHVPVTIRIAPPSVFTPSPIKLSYSGSPTSEKVSDQVDPCDARTVVAALKENSRKRVRREDLIDCDPKRQRCDSSSNCSSTSISMSNLGDSDHLHPMEECEPTNSQSLSSKRPATPGPMTEMVSGLVHKRHKNNAILSSYSSFKRTANQKSELPVKKQVKVGSPVRDRFSQTENPWPSSDTQATAAGTPVQNSGVIQDSPSTKQVLEGVELRTVQKSPFPALKEGFSPIQNIGFYADIGKSSKKVYTMPSYLPSLEDFQHDKQLEQKRLNHLLFRSKRPVDPDKAVSDHTNSSAPPVSMACTVTSEIASTEQSTVSSDDAPPQPKFPTFSLPAVTPSTSTALISSPSNNTSDSEHKSDALQKDSVPKPTFPGTGFFPANLNWKPTPTTTKDSSIATATSAVPFNGDKPTESANESSLISHTSVTSSGIFNSSLAKPTASLSPFSSTSLIKNTTPTSTTFSASFFKPPSNMPEKASITTLTTATTTQTSIPSLSLFTSPSNMKESVSSPLSFVSQPSTTTISPSCEASKTPSVQTVFSSSSMCTPTSAPPPPYPTTSSLPTTAPLTNSFPTSTTAVSTLTQGTNFAFKAKSGTFDLQSSTSSSEPARNIFLEHGALGSHPPSTSQPNMMFASSVPASSLAKETSLPKLFEFRTSADKASAFSATSTAASNMFFSTTTSAPTMSSSTPQPASSFPTSTVFSLPQASSSGNTSSAAPTISQSNLAFGISSPSAASTFGISSRPNVFSTSSPPINFNSPALTTSTFGPSMQQATSPFSTSSTSTTFGQFTPSSGFGQTSQTGNAFGQPSQLTNVFGTTVQQQQQLPAFGQTAPAFGSSTQPPAPSFVLSNQTFGSLASQQQGSAFGARPSEEPFGGSGATTSQSVFTADNKSIFMASANPVFGSTTSPSFGSPFGNTSSTSLGAFGNPSGPPSTVFDNNKGLNLGNSAPSLFGTPVTSSSETPTFNAVSSASTMNFNFSKPNFNFGAGTTNSTPTFGTGTTSQPFVFTGGVNPNIGLGSTVSSNQFFSIGSGSKDRNKLQARKRFSRK